jgi:hypothetical protein
MKNRRIRRIRSLELWMMIISMWYKNLRKPRRSIVVPRPGRSKSFGIRRVDEHCTQLDDIVALQALVRCLSAHINSNKRRVHHD